MKMGEVCYYCKEKFPLEKECCVKVCQECSIRHNECDICKNHVPKTFQKIIRLQYGEEWIPFINWQNCKEKKFEVTPQELALKMQDIEMIKWLEKYGLYDEDKRKIMSQAINLQNIEIISFLKNKDYPFDYESELHLLYHFKMTFEVATAIINA